MMDEGQEQIERAYGPAKYRRLRALKQKYDPDNFFRLNQNIPPSQGTSRPTGRQLPARGFESRRSGLSKCLGEPEPSESHDVESLLLRNTQRPSSAARLGYA